MMRFTPATRFARDHRWAPRRMSAYLDDDLVARARARMDRHTAECADCRGVLESLRCLVGVLQQSRHGTSIAPVPDIAGAVRRRLREEPGQ